MRNARADFEQDFSGLIKVHSLGDFEVEKEKPVSYVSDLIIAIEMPTGKLK